MKSIVLKSRKALLLHGALTGALLPLLAQDKKIDVSPLLGDVTAKNFSEKKPLIAAGLKKLSVGKLAADADLDSVVGLLDKLDDMKDGASEEADELGPDQPAVDSEDPMAKALAFCKGKLSDEDFAELSALTSVGATDEELDGDPDAPKKPEDGAPKPGDNPQAMDAQAIEARVLKRVREVSEARAIVEPIVGKVNLALDAAGPIYDLALDHLGIKAAGVNTAGKRALIETAMAGKVKATAPVRPQIAQDAADAEAEFREAFPNASNLRGRR